MRIATHNNQTDSDNLGTHFVLFCVQLVTSSHQTIQSLVANQNSSQEPLIIIFCF